MKKYIAIGFGIVSVVAFSMAVGASGFPFIRRGDVQENLSSNCLTAISDAILSVYPQAQISKVDRWYCDYLLIPESDPLKKEYKCEGDYRKTLTNDEWYAAVISGENVSPADESIKRTPRTALSAAQTAAQTAILSECFSGLSLDDLLDFTIYRQGGVVKARANYADSVLTKSELRQLAKDGKVIKFLIPE